MPCDRESLMLSMLGMYGEIYRDRDGMGAILKSVMPALEPEELAALVDKWVGMSAKELETALKWVGARTAKAHAKAGAAAS